MICGILRKLERGGYGKRKKEDKKRGRIKQMRGGAMRDPGEGLGAKRREDETDYF